MRHHRPCFGPLFAGLVTLIGLIGPAAAQNAEAPSAGQAPSAIAGGIRILSVTSSAAVLPPQDLERQPMVTVQAKVPGAFGGQKMAFKGPLVWQLLVRARVVDPGRDNDAKNDIVKFKGKGGQVAEVPVKSLMPGKAGISAIVAVSASGKPFGAGHLSAVIPGAGGAHGTAQLIPDLQIISVVKPPG